MAPGQHRPPDFPIIADRKVVLTAVSARQNGRALEFASERLRDDVITQTKIWLRDYNTLLLLYLLIPVAVFLIGWKTAAVLLTFAGVMIALALSGNIVGFKDVGE